MERLFSVFVAGLMIFSLVAGMVQAAEPFTSAAGEHGLSLSDMQVKITSRGRTATFRLYDTVAARDLYAQLPLSIEVENYGGAEKIFYPPKKLNTANTPRANARAGTLAYYAPWGDVVFFYGDFGSASGLYELGNAVSGSEPIRGMSGTIRIEK